MTERKVEPPGEANLNSCIGFWDSVITHEWFLLSPSVQFLVKHTLKCLRELKELKEKLQGD